MDKRTCSIEGCDEPAHARGWCSRHYGLWRHHGDPLYVIPSPQCECECSEDGCHDPAWVRGWCMKHYQRWRLHGSPTAIAGLDLTAEQRFLAKVNKDGPSPEHRPELGPCWLWTASISNLGYGQFGQGGRSKSMAAHRWSYEHFVKPIPDGLELDHLCRVRHCVRPEHLEPVTHAENMRRARGYRKRPTHCPKNHPYDEANTLIGRDGRINCRTCKRESWRAWRLKQKEARHDDHLRGGL